MPTDTQPIRAAGVILRAPSGRILLLKRTDGAGWSFPGGVIESGESPEQAAWREVHEETGFRLGDVGRELMRRVKGGTDYLTFLCDIEDQFVPRLNSEHSGFGWFEPRSVLEDASSEPDDLDPEAGQTIIDSIDRLDARLAAIGG